MKIQSSRYSMTILIIGIMGLLTGLAVAYGLFARLRSPVVHLMIPGPGEHFAVRRTQDGGFILDVMDARGNLLRTAGSLRSGSVARAAVLPPEIAARLGAKGAFERFELNEDGQFFSTDKEEGYRIFPFVLD